jgi:hypothetical protein
MADMISQAVRIPIHAATRELVARTAPRMTPSSLTGTSTVKSPPGSPSVMRSPVRAACTPVSAVAGPLPRTRLPLRS